MNGNNIIYFDSFGIEQIPKEITKLIGNKDIIAIFIECKQMVGYCVDISVLDLLVLRWKARFGLIIPTDFPLNNMRKMIK